MILFYIAGGVVLEKLDQIDQQIISLTTNKQVDIDNRMKQLIEDYISIVKLISHVNSCFGMFIFLITLSEFFSIFTAFAYLHVSISNLDLLFLPTFMGFILPSSIYFFCVNHTGEQLIQKVCNIPQFHMTVKDVSSISALRFLSDSQAVLGGLIGIVTDSTRLSVHDTRSSHKILLNEFFLHLESDTTALSLQAFVLSSRF